MHANEPSLDELKQIRQQVYAAPSTDENLQKIHAIEVQIDRHEKVEKDSE